MGTLEMRQKEYGAYRHETTRLRTHSRTLVVDWSPTCARLRKVVGMSEKEFLIDAVAQFLQSAKWLDAIAGFLETHYRPFLPTETAVDQKASSSPSETETAENSEGEDAKEATTGHSLQQYDTFLQFKDLVERLLEALIAELGCSGEDLVSILEASARLGVSASRERCFFIKTLLSFESYHAFYRKISQFAAEKQASGCVVAEEENEGDSSDWSPEYSEWILQHAIAKSVLELNALGQLDETEEGLVVWAEALVQMSQHSDDVNDQTSLDGSSEEEAKATETTPNDDRMKELERTLIRERLKVDLLVAQRITDANAEIKKQMLHLVASEIDEQLADDDAAAGDPSENELAGLFAQVETIQARLKQVKAQCFEFTTVAQAEMDRMYLFLKEKVHYQQDLVSQEKDISDFIFTQIQESDAPLIPLLLEWLLLESEGLRVQTQIQDQLNGARDEGYWVQDWDEGSKAFYYVHSVTNESIWEAPACGYMDMNQQFVSPAWDGCNESASTFTPGEQVAEWNDASAAYEGGENRDDQGNEESTTAQLSLDKAATQLDATLQSGGGCDSGQLLEMESVMERISREHDEERKRLELLFQVEKARQKEELRKRKEKKRRERMAKNKIKADAESKERRGAEGNDGIGEKADANAIVRAVREPPPPLSARGLLQQSPRLPMKAEEKSGAPQEKGFSIVVPGHGRVDLSHLLSDSHAKRFQERKGLPSLQPPPPQTLLNPSTLRYLTEKMMKKDPTNWGYGTAKQELVLEETGDFAADEK